MKEGLIEKIRSRGYIRVNFRPIAYEERRVSLPDCENLVKENAVRLRGWNYPHFPQRRDDDTSLDIEDDFIQGWIDWSIHREFWRMYRSGQFLHYIAYPEDWYDERHWPGQMIDPNSVLGVGGTIIFGLTEVFEFLKRLAVAELYEDGAWVSIQFHGLKNRKLWVDDPMKAPFLAPKTSSSEAFKWVGELSSTDIVTRVQENALKVIEELVYRFGWRNIAVDAIRAQQLQFLSGEHSVG